MEPDGGGRPVLGWIGLHVLLFQSISMASAETSTHQARLYLSSDESGRSLQSCRMWLTACLLRMITRTRRGGGKVQLSGRITCVLSLLCLLCPILSLKKGKLLRSTEALVIKTSDTGGLDRGRFDLRITSACFSFQIRLAEALRDIYLAASIISLVFLLLTLFIFSYFR